MFIKIVLTRLIKEEGMGLFMLIMPTFSLLCAISQMGFPTAISKLVAEDRFNNKKLVLGIIPISLVINLFIIILLIFSSSFIANVLLKDPRTHLGIMAIGFVLPFVSISSILRGYFFGKERMLPHVISNILEDIIRLVLIIIFIPILMNKGLEYVVAFLIIISIFSELSSIIIFMVCAPKKIQLKKDDFKLNHHNLKNIFSISIPTTGSRLIGSIGYFLEPIILTFALSKSGYSNFFIVREYGIINGYVLPLLLLPSFFTLAISQAIIPIISKSYSRNDLITTKRKIKQSIFFSLMIGIPATLIFMLIPEIPLKLIYDTDIGINYIRTLAPIFLLHYIQAPLVSSLQAMGKAKEAMFGTLIGMIFRTITLFILSMAKIGIWGLVIATSVNIVIVTSHQYIKIKKILN